VLPEDGLLGPKDVARILKYKVYIVVYRLKAGLHESSGRPLLRNVYNKNAYVSDKGVKTSSVSAETNTLTTAASQTVKLKDSTRCLLDRPADGYNRQIQI
jgi:hypothetical protein